MPKIPRAISRAGMLGLVFAAFLQMPAAPAVAGTTAEVAGDYPLVTNLAQLRRAVAGDMGCLGAYALEGTVMAADPESGAIFLNDGVNTEILETTLAGPFPHPGQRVRLGGTNYLVTTDTGISLGPRPVVENDGMHSENEGSATLFLKAGKYPIELLWFNNVGDWFLQLDYAGPGFGRRRVPDSALFHAAPSAGERPAFAPGVNYRCYEGAWQKLPSFPDLRPVKAGVTNNFNPDAKTRKEFVGLVFDGFIQIDDAGAYTFYLRSDDGSRLFLNEGRAQLAVIGQDELPAPEKILVRQPVTAGRGPFWAEAEGRVTFIGRQYNHRAEIELSSDDAHMRAVVYEAGDQLPDGLLGARARVRGVCLTAVNETGHEIADTLVIPDWSHIEALTNHQAAVANSNSLPILTTAEQVQQLSREDARRGYSVQLEGVVTWVAENRDCMVLQDATRGVFVGLRKAWTLDVPKLGDVLQIEGECVPAEFSPIVILSRGTKVGRGLLPPPIHPSWEQLIGGSLDDQYIEISGLATGSGDTNHLTLLMPGGKAELEFFPAPAAPLASFIHSVVRIRGVMFANWDVGTHMVTPSRPLRFGSAIICADIPPPSDPFSADRMHARELMQFDVRRNTFQRVKVLGQCLCVRRGTCFMSDQGFGFRVEPVQPIQCEPGDLLDVVGLVELGGASPVLREAITRKISRQALPPPEPLDFDQAHTLHDSTRVWVAGLLLGIKDTGADRVLEMQSGLNHFAARLPANAAVSWPTGSRLKLTGTLSWMGTDTPDGRHYNSVELLLNSPSDVALIARPTWWTLGRLLTTVAVLAFGLALAFIWITQLRDQVERRTRQLRREISERQKAEQERAIEQERSRIALDLHDDLGSRLTAISMLATTAQGPALSAEVSRERLQLIADKARLMVTTLDGLVWAVDPKNDTVSSLAEYLASFAEEFLARTGIACHVNLPREFPERTVAADARHNVLLAVREALNNAVRHGRPTEVHLQLTCSEHELSIVLRENGCGFDPARSTPGNGLANLRERLRKVNGQCRIQSSPGVGTTVTLTLPV